ncbi:hypothetical protein BGX26_011678 [Mortierella sp. AD094]|nr:hypothetical protein BGX26_011678 [Mortierella sp. AD094]
MSFPTEDKAHVQVADGASYSYQSEGPVPVGYYKSKSVTFKDSISHPINVSWIIPPWIDALLEENMTIPNNMFLIPYAQREAEAMQKTDVVEDAVTRAKRIYTNWRPRGNLGLSSCPGKKVRLDGPVNGRAKIVRDLDLDFDRLQNLGFTRVICCLFDEELELLGSPFPKYLEAANSHGVDVIRDHREVIEWVRAQRSPKAIETKEQAQFVAGFYLWTLGGESQVSSKLYEVEIMRRIDWSESNMAIARADAAAKNEHGHHNGVQQQQNGHKEPAMDSRSQTASISSTATVSSRQADPISPSSHTMPGADKTSP